MKKSFSDDTFLRILQTTQSSQQELKLRNMVSLKPKWLGQYNDEAESRAAARADLINCKVSGSQVHPAEVSSWQEREDDHSHQTSAEVNLL
jgi:hypothetical protein